MLRVIYIFLVALFLGFQVVASEVSSSNALISSSGIASEHSSVLTDTSELLSAGQIALEDGFGAVAEKSFLSVLNAEVQATNSEFSTSISLANDGLIQALLLQEKYGELLARVDFLIDNGSMDVDAANYWRAVALSRKSNYIEAVELLSSYEANPPKSKLGEGILRLLALSRLKSGNVIEAISVFELFDDEFPKSEEFNLNRLDWGKALIFLGKYKEALDAFKPVLKDDDIYLVNDARYWVGKAYLQLNEVDKGIDSLELLLSSENITEDLRVNAVLAVVKGRVIEPSEAKVLDKDVTLLTNTLSRVSGVDSKRKISFELCRLLLDGGRLDEAVPRVKAYISANSDEVTAASLQLKLGDAFLNAEKYEDAVAVYQHYLEIFVNAGGHANARRGSGWALMGVERFAESALAFEKAYDLFELDEQKMECLFKVGDAIFLNAQYKKAISVYEKFLSEFPDSKYNVKALFQIGVCQELLDEYEDAEKTFESVVRKYAESEEAAEALLHIGALYEAKEDWKKAENLYERVMKVYPDGPLFAKALRRRGMARYQLWAPDALDDFVRLGDEFPNSKDAEYALYMRAMCLYRLGRDAQALEICQQFMKQYKDSEWAPSVRLWIGKFAYNSGDYEVAEKEFLGFIDQYPEHDLADSAVFRSGMTALKRKEYVHAIELFGLLVKSYPKSRHLAEARFRQADAMSELGKFSAAILVFDEVIIGFPKSSLVPMAWGRKGDCQFTLGADDEERYEEAIRSYRVVTQSPKVRWDRVLQAEYKIGLSLEKLGRSDEALEYYYSNVMVPFLVEREKENAIPESAKVWFTRGALAAADIVTEKNDLRQLVRILNRIVEADVAISADAEKRIKEIESEKWWLFY